MATLTVDRPLTQRSLLDPHEETSSPRPPQPRATRPARSSLDDLVAGTWDSLAVTHAAACIVCGHDLTPRFSAGPHPVGAACSGCGSELS